MIILTLIIEILNKIYIQNNLAIGNVFTKYSNFTMQNLTFAFSTGLLASTPIGPLSVCYGWNEHQRNILYLSVGYEF